MELLQYTFFQHALIGSLLASIACGLIGTYIVTRRLVFISGGLTTIYSYIVANIFSNQHLVSSQHNSTYYSM